MDKSLQSIAESLNKIFEVLAEIREDVRRMSANNNNPGGDQPPETPLGTVLGISSYSGPSDLSSSSQSTSPEKMSAQECQKIRDELEELAKKRDELDDFMRQSD